MTQSRGAFVIRDCHFYLYFFVFFFVFFNQSDCVCTSHTNTCDKEMLVIHFHSIRSFFIQFLNVWNVWKVGKGMGETVRSCQQKHALDVLHLRF